MSKIILSLLALSVLAGCGSVSNVRVADQGEITASRLNRITNSRIAKVYLTDGMEIYGADVEVAVDSTNWLDPSSFELVSVATADVRRITVVRAMQGALVGLGVGIVGGALFGLVRAIREGDDPPDDFPAASAEEKLRIYPPAHAVYASLGTTPIGAIVGRKRTFVLVHE